MKNKFLVPEIANNYDDYYQSAIGKNIDSIEKAIISNLLTDIPRSDMLELGCGTGHWSSYFIKQGFKLVGIDISESMLGVAKLKNIDAEFIIGDASNIPFEDESFDIISSITMLEFVDNQDKVIQEIHRVLRKGGWFVLGGLNANSIVGKNKDKDEVFKNATFFTIDDLKLLLKKFGNPIFESGVFMKPDYSLEHNANNNESIEPVFIGCIVQKI